MSAQIGQKDDFADVDDLLEETKVYGASTNSKLLGYVWGRGPISVGRGGRNGGGAGTGLRNPYGPLHDMPKSHRKAILDRAKEADLIEFIADDELGKGYVITERGIEFIRDRYSCKHCGGDVVPDAYERGIGGRHCSASRTDVVWVCRDGCDAFDHDGGDFDADTPWLDAGAEIKEAKP